MLTFEIRILKADGSLSMATTMTHLNADAAVRSAKRLAGKKQFEVWANDRCIYTSPVSLHLVTATPPTWPAA